MSDIRDDSQPGISPSRLRRVIQRAQELEYVRAEHVSVDEVHEIARQLGLSRHAIDQALAEATEPESAALERYAGHQPISVAYAAALSGGLGALFGLIGGILGTLGPAFLPTDIAVVAPIAMYVTTAAAALQVRGRHRHRDFQIINAIGWSVFGVVFCLALLPSIPLYRAVDMFWGMGTLSAAGGVVIVAARDLWRNRSKIGPTIRRWLRTLISSEPRDSGQPSGQSEERGGYLQRIAGWLTAGIHVGRRPEQRTPARVEM